MRSTGTTPPESIIKALSKPNGRNSAKAVGALLDWGKADRDPILEQRSHQLLLGVTRTLESALPNTDRELIGGFCANLLDRWETGQKLNTQLERLVRLRFPKDKEALRDALQWIEAIQLDMASYWIDEVKQDLSKLARALDQSERRPDRNTPRKPKRSPRKKAE